MIRELAVVVGALHQVQEILAQNNVPEPVVQQLLKVVKNEEVERALRALSAATAEETREQRPITGRTIAAS